MKTWLDAVCCFDTWCDGCLFLGDLVLNTLTCYDRCLLLCVKNKCLISGAWRQDVPLNSSPAQLNSTKDNISEQASSTSGALTGPTLELTHRDNQTVFTLSSSAAADSANCAETSATDTHFQSIEKRRSKLLENLNIKIPANEMRTRPIMEVKPRPNSSTPTVSPTGETAPAGKHILKGAKPVFPKPKPKPASKKPVHSKQVHEASQGAGEYKLLQYFSCGSELLVNLVKVNPL